MKKTLQNGSIASGFELEYPNEDFLNMEHFTKMSQQFCQSVKFKKSIIAHLLGHLQPLRDYHQLHHFHYHPGDFWHNLDLLLHF